MTTLIRTQWHKLLPLIAAGNVTLTAPKDGYAEWYEDCGGKLDVLAQFIKDMSGLPHFVVERELIDLAGTDAYQRSLYDMKRANVLRLPYPAMIVEYPGINNGTNFQTMVLIRDLHDKTAKLTWELPDFAEHPFDDANNPDELPMDFYGIRMSIERDKDGDYMSFSPSLVFGAIEQRDGDPWIRFGGYAHAVLPISPKVNKIVETTYMKDAGAVFYAVSAAYLLMRTQGVDAETIDTTKINRKRSNSDSQPYIPKYTYIKIGRVYRNLKTEDTDEYIPRKSPRPHWRRGHLRHVRYGSGRVNIKEIYIYPRLVALKSDSIIPPSKSYKVLSMPKVTK